MGDREYFATERRHIAAPPALVWALVADSNRWDRAVGLSPGTYEFRPAPGGGDEPRIAVASTREMGMKVSWIEPPYEWVEGQFLHGARTFLSGPLTRGGMQIDLEPEGNGTRVDVRAFVAADRWPGHAAGVVMRARFRKALERYLSAVETVLTGASDAIELRPEHEPAVAAARRSLLSAPTEETTSGTSSPLDESNFAVRAQRFERAPIDATVRTRLLEHLRTRPDEELGQIRPFELARAWSLDRREVLRAFLHATRAGLLDLRWQLNCPSCRVGAEHADSLADVGRAAHCTMCNIGFDLDFAEHVEAVFKISPALRKVESALYCASSPWFRPHVFAQLVLAPGTTRTFAIALPLGRLLLRTLQQRRERAELSCDAAPPASLHIELSAQGLVLEASGETSAGAPTAVTVRNATESSRVLLVERQGWSAEIALGSVIATLPDFLDLFATEAPATGVELSVGALTLLFSDLTGSTAMYERLGDARAFAIVQEHFQMMRQVVARHRGAIVKTMGDAVMATFESPVDALRASLEMVAETQRAHGDLGLSVKLGVHEGPCLAVRANEQLDFFGTTVNVAARLQAQARANQIVIAQELLEHPEIARVVHERGVTAHPFEARLKGIREVQQLVHLDAGKPLAQTG